MSAVTDDPAGAIEDYGRAHARHIEDRLKCFLHVQVLRWTAVEGLLDDREGVRRLD
jgi:hypothetical protein